MAAFVANNLNFAVDGEVAQVPGEYASDAYFGVLGVEPALGRVLTAADDELQPPVAVLNYAFWQARFGGDPEVLGKTVLVDDRQFTIVGIAEPRFTGRGAGSSRTIPVVRNQPVSVSGVRHQRRMPQLADIDLRLAMKQWQPAVQVVRQHL